MVEKTYDMAQLAAKALSDKKAMEIKILDLAGLTPIADYFIIASGTSLPHVQALADEVEEKLGKLGIPARHKEGFQTGRWILLDFGDVVVHVFNDEERKFYSLEKVWGDAKIIPVDGE